MMNRNFQRELDQLISALDSRPRLLLHACCAPCSTYVTEYLSRCFEITLFYYNPNTHPREEYLRRLDALHTLAETVGLPILEGEYHPEEFFSLTKGLENAPEGGDRCTKCFELRLRETARTAKELGFDFFCSTLSISPHKNAPLLNAIGEALAAEFGIGWLPNDFKKKGGFLRSTELSKQLGLYRQNYCGCVYSIPDKIN